MVYNADDDFFSLESSMSFKNNSVRFAEYENEYYFVRTKLNWEALEEAPYAAYGSITSFIGNILMVTVMSKYLKVNDAILAIISSSCTAVSKLVCVSVPWTLIQEHCIELSNYIHRLQ